MSSRSASTNCVCGRTLKNRPLGCTRSSSSHALRMSLTRGGGTAESVEEAASSEASDAAWRSCRRARRLQRGEARAGGVAAAGGELNAVR
eukprot:2943548-Prymnesium_polylepis.1